MINEEKIKEGTELRQNLFLKSTFVPILLLVIVISGCSAPNTPTSNPTPAATSSWSPTLTLPTSIPPQGSLTLSGGIKVIPSVESPWPEIPVLEYVYKMAEIKIGGEFSIGLDTDFGLGVSWDLNYDKNIISLVANEPAYHDGRFKIGTSWFRLKAISEGIAIIKFDLINPHMTDAGIIMSLPFVIIITKQ